MTHQARPIEILLVEDGPTDVMLTRRALKKAKVSNRLHVVGTGLEAMKFLNHQNGHSAAPRPDLVLLDLNLPVLDGREVLRRIKNDEELCKIPVIVLTTSRDERDICQAYGLHANCYITKPVDFDQFATVVKVIDDFWFTIVTLPHADDDEEDGEQ